MEFKLSDDQPYTNKVEEGNCFLKCEGNPHEEGTCQLACEFWIFDDRGVMPYDVLLEKVKTKKSDN